MGNIVSITAFNGRVMHARVQSTTAAKHTGKTEFNGNRWTQLQLPFAVLSSQNWNQTARKIGGYRLAFNVLKRHFEEIGPVSQKAA